MCWFLLLPASSWKCLIGLFKLWTRDFFFLNLYFSKPYALFPSESEIENILEVNQESCFDLCEKEAKLLLCCLSFVFTFTWDFGIEMT